MPWCDECARFLTPTSMAADGSCPSCGRVLAPAVPARAPWHFLLLLVAIVLYLALRAWQGVSWLLHRL